MTKFICISGQAQHGKDTSAQMLKEELTNRGYSVLVIHYADLLKFICKNFFGWNGEKDERGRSLLQYVGTECVRKKDPDFWVDFVADIVRMFPGVWQFVIVPDARFPNEIERISDAGFPVVHARVVRSGFDNQLTDAQKKHKSETALNGVAPDVWLMNTSMDVLRAQINVLCDTLIEARKHGGMK